MDPSYFQRMLEKVQRGQGGPRQSDLSAFQPFPMGNQQDRQMMQQYQQYMQQLQQQRQGPQRQG